MKCNPTIARLENLLGAILTFVVLLSLTSNLYAQSDSDNESDKTKPRMEEMASVIDGVQLEVTTKGRKEKAKRIEHALLRTIETSKDVVGRSEDGSLWLFEHGGLPVAIVELWATSGSHNWGHTLLAVTRERLGGMAGGNRWTPGANAGVAFEPVPKASPPRPKPNLRQVQMRQISRRFKTNIEDPGRNDSQQFRLIAGGTVGYRFGPGPRC